MPPQLQIVITITPFAVRVETNPPMDPMSVNCVLLDVIKATLQPKPAASSTIEVANAQQTEALTKPKLVA